MSDTTEASTMEEYAEVALKRAATEFYLRVWVPEKQPDEITYETLRSKLCVAAIQYGKHVTGIDVEEEGL